MCWIHAERLIHKLDTFTGLQRAAQNRMRGLNWPFYRTLKTYRTDTTSCRRTGFATLDRLLARLQDNKPKLLMVLNRPDIPLHTNGSENDIRCQVTKREISGDTGRDCRDAFLGGARTCAKLGVSFWDYLGDRLAVPNC